MTEITANIEPPEQIKPVAFIAALILAPLVFSAPFLAIYFFVELIGARPGGWAVLVAIPIFALAFGAIPYLVAGTPAFIAALRRKTSTAFAGFKANLMACPVIFLIFAVRNGADALGLATFFLLFGCIFAPLWGAVFGWLYRNFARI